jgi:hypothetical protein
MFTRLGIVVNKNFFTFFIKMFYPSIESLHLPNEIKEKIQMKLFMEHKNDLEKIWVPIYELSKKGKHQVLLSHDRAYVRCLIYLVEKDLVEAGEGDILKDGGAFMFKRVDFPGWFYFDKNGGLVFSERLQHWKPHYVITPDDVYSTRIICLGFFRRQ